MRIVIFALLFALSVPGIWAQKYPKKPVDATSHQPIKLGLSSLRAHPHLKAAQSPPPAAGVAQCYVDPNGALSGDFVNTSTIPSGSTITGSILLEDDGSYIDFTGETLTSPLTPGSIVLLPTITNFGDLWYSSGAALDIAVQIQPARGTTTEVDCQVLVGEAFSNSDLASNEPLISTVTQSMASNNDLDLVLNGYFTPDSALVVLTDLYNIYVVPAGAISIVSGTQINVDLSQVSGLDLTSSDTLFVTVSQDGLSDTVEYRYLPPASGFNLAPQ
jgi:hypothetical protein